MTCYPAGATGRTLDDSPHASPAEYAERVRCEGCGREVDVSGVFPGAKIACACGAYVEVDAPGRANALGGPYREAAAVPKAPEHRAATRKHGVGVCPRCGGPFDDADDPVQDCLACGGAFVARNALDEVIAARRFEPEEIAAPPPGVAVVPATEVRYLRCPRCSEPMNRMLFGKRSGIVVDVCNVHGTWFDATELDRAARYVAATGETPPQPPGPKTARATPPGAVEAEAARGRVALESELYRETQEEKRRWRWRAGHRGGVVDLLLALVGLDPGP